MKSIYNAESYLGVHVDAVKESPSILSSEFKKNVNKYRTVKSKNIIKNQDKNNKRKNIKEVNSFNKKLYNKIKRDKNFVITIGGDHSIAIASALASIKKNDKLGLIWFDSHSDYHTFDTTVSGNIHGLPFATLTGNNRELSLFHDGNYYNPKDCVLVGVRSIDEGEADNLRKAGITIFTTENIKEQGVKDIVEKAFDIALKNNNKIHISYDLDLIDPNEAPGVSVPEINGISKKENEMIVDYIVNNINEVASIDIVEYNKLNDIGDKTYNLGKNIIEKIVNK